MSSTKVEEGNTQNPQEKEILTVLKDNCQNFIKMSQDEKSEGIKINYFIGLNKLCDSLKISPSIYISTIFDEILFKDLTILKSRNLLSIFISSLQSKNMPELFESKFFSLLLKFGADYSQNTIYFHQYLIDISLIYIFNSTYKCQEKTDYIAMIIENDIKPFETQLLKNIINKKKKLIDGNENKTYMSKCLFTKLITMNKYKSCIIIFQKILENKSVPKEIILEIIKSTNAIGFSHIAKKTKEINDFLIFNCLLLDNFDEKLFVSEEEKDMLDTYLLNLINLLSLKKDLNIDIFQKVYKFFNVQCFKNLNRVFPDVLYFLSTYSYIDSQYEFLFNCLKSTNINIIYHKLIYTHLLSMQKKPINYNYRNVQKFKFMIDEKLNTNFDDLNKINFLFDDNNKYNNSLSFLNHINLYNYIINSSFAISKGSGFSTLITFNPKILNRILNLINNLSLEISNKKFFEDFLNFIFDLFSLLIELYLSNNESLIKEDYLFNTLVKIIDTSSIDNKYSILFPNIINLVKNSLFDSYEKITDNSNDNKIYELIFNCLIMNYSSNINNPTFVNDQQNIIIFKSLLILLLDKNCPKIKKKFLAIDKIVDLVVKSNNTNVKLFEAFYKLCEDLQQSPDEENKHLSYYALNKYSKISTNVLDKTFYIYLSEKFKEVFVQKLSNNIKLDEYTFFVISTISNSYNNEQFKYNDDMREIQNIKTDIEDFCGNRIIFGIIESLFNSIEKNELDFMKLNNKNDNLFEQYNFMTNAMNNLDYQNYMKECYFDKKNPDKCNLMCHYGILKSLAHLFSGYLSNCIRGIKDIKDNEKNKSERLHMVLDYIKDKILYNESIRSMPYPIILLNGIFSDKINLQYFLIKFCINSVDTDNKESNMIIDSSIAEMKNVNSAFISFIKQNPFYIIFMKDIISNYIDIDSNILNKGKKINKKTGFIYKIDNVVSKMKEKILNKPEDEIKSINSFFSKIFTDEIYERNEPSKNLEKNQIIFIFLLDNSLMEKLFESFYYFVNINYSMIQLYSIQRYKNLPVEFNVKYIDFINKNIGYVGNHVLKILSNKKTFNLLFKTQNINNKYMFILFNIIENIMTNLTNNSKNENDNLQLLKNSLNLIIDYLESFYSIEQNLSNLVFYIFGKLIKTLLKILNEKSKQENQEQTNATIDDFYKSIIPKYIELLYKRILSVFDKNNTTINFEYSLYDIYKSFYLVLEIISGVNIQDNKYYNLLQGLINSDILNFFDGFKSFDRGSDNSINENFLNIFKEKYVKTQNEEILKKFLENLFLFILVTAKLDEKNIKNIILDLFGEFKDKKENEIFKNLAYVACYILSTIRKDNNKDNNKNKNNLNLLKYGDYIIICGIGGRFKEDEKSLIKKVASTSNLK